MCDSRIGCQPPVFFAFKTKQYIQPVQKTLHDVAPCYKLQTHPIVQEMHIVQYTQHAEYHS